MYRFTPYEQHRAAYDHALVMQLFWQKVRLGAAVLSVILGGSALLGAILCGLYVALKVGAASCGL